MSVLLIVHSRLLNSILLYFGALAIWGGFGYLRRQPISGSYRGGLVIGELLMLVEFVVGLVLLLGGSQAARTTFHIMYGFVAVLTLPAIAVFARGRSNRWMNLFYALACLFLCGIALRALATARG